MKETKEWLYHLRMQSVKGLSEFLKTRAEDEDLGQSLDCFVKKLQSEGNLTNDVSTSIRAIHLGYQSDLLTSGIPLLVECKSDRKDDEILREFYYEAEDVLYSGKLDGDTLTDFLRKYSKTDSPYVGVNIIMALMRYGEYQLCYPFVQTFAQTIFTKSINYWNNSGDIYSCSQLLYLILSLLGNNGIEKLKDRIPGIYKKILEHCYLLLSRVICWPEDKSNMHRNLFSDSEEYEDKISSLIKRADIMLRYENYFNNLVPSYSTPGSLAVSDYSLAHDFSFATNKLGRKSQFKRDAKNLYNRFEEFLVKPYSTAIHEGKRDGIELAHRFYIKLKKGDYYIEEPELDVLMEAIKNALINKQSLFDEKKDKAAIIHYLHDNGFVCFYHFTERENLKNIKKYGGLYSQRECITQAVPMHTVGDMRPLRDKDASFNLENYVRLSFCQFHPLINYRKDNGADIVILKVKPDVAWLKETLFSDRDAAKDDHKHGGRYEDLLRVNVEAVKKRVFSKEDINYDRNQAEVMVKSFIPITYILNLYDPIEVNVNNV